MNRRDLLFSLLILLLAIGPRTAALDDFFTIDEGYHWIGRTDRFAAAVAARDWAATDQTGHPGVTTMWLGSLGRALAAARGVTNPGWAGGGATYLGYLRLPLAAANALAVAVGYLLLIGLVGRRAALLGAIFWATSPFLIAHSRLLHLDALLTSCMTLSLLCLLAARGAPVASSGEQQIRPKLLIASAVLAGLALLTKAPALLLIPFAGVILLADVFVPSPGGRAAALRRAIALGLLWGGVAAITFALLWPAMWVNPLGAFGSILAEVRDNGGNPHHSGNYFLGVPVGVPGPLFYPAVVAFRTTPWTLVGLIVWLASLAWRRPLSQLLLGLFALYITLFLSIEAKQFDRYLLPIWPTLEILAACGWVWLVRMLLARMGRVAQADPPTARRRAVVGWGLTLALTLAPLLPRHSYYLGYFNPLLGGPAVAQRVLLVGWGEGFERVGAWLSARPDLDRGPVLSWTPPNLAPFVPKRVQVLDLRPEYLARPSSYVVRYIRSIQRGESPEADAAALATPALFSVESEGVVYATVHQLVRPYAVRSPARFAGSLRLNGYTATRDGALLTVVPSWSVARAMPAGALVFVHVLDASGATVGRVDAAIDGGMFAQWQAGQQFDAPLPIQLPADLAPGPLRLVIGVYTPDGARLPIDEATALPPGVDGPNALLLATLR